MTEPKELYTPGYSEEAVKFMMRRTAATHAAFFTRLLRPGMRLLDCGCGPGTITLDLAKLVSPGEAIGIDVEPSQIHSAQALAKDRAIEAHFQVASVYALPFPDHRLDAVFAHAVFEHLREPAKALLEIRRVLKPSGFVGMRSPDWGGYLIYPSTPELEEAIRLYKELQIANGGDVYMGRRLKGLLREAGFAKISVSASYECYQEPAAIAEYIALRLESRGHTQVRESWEKVRTWSQHPDAFFAQAWCEAAGWVA